MNRCDLQSAWAQSCAGGGEVRPLPAVCLGCSAAGPADLRGVRGFVANRVDPSRDRIHDNYDT